MTAMTVATISHIVIDDRGIARISGSRIRVVDIVLDKQAQGWSPEEIQQQHPHLSLAQVHAALAYYYDHKAELDAKIQRDFEEVERMRKEAGEPPFVTRLRAEGKLK
jgi:uncharacterized protein (DUF433 family)